MKKGYTLIEVIVVVVLMAILAVIVSPVLQSGFNAYLTQRDLSAANAQGVLALARMTRDIQSMPGNNAISTATASQFSFTDNTNNSVSYTLSGTNLQRNTKTLAGGIHTCTFAYYDSAGATTATIANIRYLTITMNITQNNVNSTVFTTIYLRNA